MSPAWIRTRVVTVTGRNPRGRTYQVLYRRGGRGYRIETAGTFKTQTEAKLRRDLVAGWLARGLNPSEKLATLLTPPRATRTRAQWRDDFLASRHDLDEKSRRTYRYGIDAAFEHVPERLEDVTVADCELAVARLAEKYAPKTVGNYWQSFGSLLEYAQIDPNPARDKRVRLPRLRRTPPIVPTASHVETLLERLAVKYLLPLALIEQTAIRVETIEEADWANVDLAGRRMRVFEKGRGSKKTRWVPLPDWLCDMLDERTAPEDRDGRLFPGVTASGLRAAMRKVCQAAGIPHYHPHDLRHRRASLWHLQGVPDAVLAERVGHERSSFTKDVYVHVMPVEELSPRRLHELVSRSAT